MNKATKITLVTAFAFILASFQLSNGKYLLVKVENQREFNSSTPVAQLHARQSHEKCWQCVYMFCVREHPPPIVAGFRRQCEQFKNEVNFPSKKWLVNCAQMQCPLVTLEIQDFCVEGLGSDIDPGINAYRRSCHKNVMYKK